jgi:ABC-type transporter Mla subunit MlaD
VDIPSAARRLTQLPRQGMAVALATPQEVSRLWAEVEHLVVQARRLLERADVVMDRLESELDEVDRLADRARSAITKVDAATSAAAETRTFTEGQIHRIQRLIDLYEPLLQRLAPVAAEASSTFRPSHLHAVSTLLEELPKLVHRFEPALTSMAALTPEMEDIAERMDNVGEIVEGMPGAKLLRRRGRAREEESTRGHES